MADLPPWCSDLEVSSTSELHKSAASFVKSLGLPTSHPSCTKGSSLFPSTSILAPQDDEYSIFSWEILQSPTATLQLLITLYYQAAPVFLAMAELWIRLFAFIVAPICISYLLSIEVGMASINSNINNNSSKASSEKKNSSGIGKYEKMTCILGLASSSVVLTDSLYVLEFGREYGAMMFGTLSLLSVRSFLRVSTGRKAYILVALPIAIWTLVCVATSYPIIQAVIGDMNLFRYLVDRELNVKGPNIATWAHSKGYSIGNGTGLDLPTFDPGFYFDESNPIMKKLSQHWPEKNRHYEIANGGNATPWLVTGDQRTGIPFLINKDPNLTPFRFWVSSPVDEEANAIDIFFPEDGIHRTDKPLYMVLHGLNGGSHEGYVKDFIQRRILDGSTVAVVIARGLMDTPVIGWNVFHGARISDVDAAAKVLKSATAQNQLLAGVGYSMGAIIISNYVARSGKKCHLDTAVSVSGGLNMREQLTFYRSTRLWQPMLANDLRNTMLGKFRRRYMARLSDDEYLEFLRSTHVSSIDRFAVVKYNSYKDLTHYYSEMSAMGDPKRIANVAIPFLVIHALDDPLITYRTLGNPEDVVSSGSGNIMMLITKSGGHVGWPLSMNPRAHGWEWMNNRASDFVTSLDHLKNKNQ